MEFFWNDVIVTGNDQKWYHVWRNDLMITSDHISAKNHIVGVSLKCDFIQFHNKLSKVFLKNFCNKILNYHGFIEDTSTLKPWYESEGFRTLHFIRYPFENGVLKLTFTPESGSKLSVAHSCIESQSLWFIQYESYCMNHTVRWSIWLSVSRSPKSFELWKKISKSFEGIMFVSFFPFANMPFLSTQQNRFESTSIYQSKFHFWKQALEVIIRC